MSEIKMLPLPDKVEVDKHLPTGVRIYAYDTEAMQLYGIAMAQHNVAARDAEIEALRAEVADARDGWHMANGTADLAMKHRDMAEARAERLAEALRKIEKDAPDEMPDLGAWSDADEKAEMAENLVHWTFGQIARAALRDHDQEMSNE